MDLVAGAVSALAQIGFEHRGDHFVDHLFRRDPGNAAIVIVTRPERLILSRRPHLAQYPARPCAW